MKNIRLFNLALLLVAVLFVQDSRAQDTLEGHTDRVWSVVFSPDGTRLASGSFDNTVRLWDVATRENIATLEGHTSRVWSVVFSPDGTRLASASYGTILLWDGATREVIATLEGHTSWVRSVVFSPDGTRLASASEDGTVKLWDVATREVIATLEGHTASVYSVVFSPDGTTLASGSFDGTVKLWDGATREVIATLEGHTIAVHSVVFSPDGTRLASASYDGTVKLWDGATREVIATLEGHTYPVFSVVFSPDGTRLASASYDRTVKLWDVATREVIATLEGHTDWVTSVVFSPDGTRLASASDDRTVKLWDVTSTLAKISGDEQQDTFGSTLVNPLVVEVRDLDNNPLPGVEVTFTVTDGDGKLSGQSTVEHATTDANGRAEAILTLGPDLRTNTVEVSIRHESVTFNAVGVSPYQLTKISGDEQQGVSGSTLVNPLVVEVRDLDNNPLPGVEVTFTVIYGDGKLSGQSTVEHATTDANGRAEAILTLGPDSVTNTVEVSIGHESVTFYAVGVSPYQLTKISGDGQQGTFGSTLANPLVVEVRDLDNNPFPGVEVTFTVTRGEGKLSGQSTVEHATTDANGRAEAILTLGPDSVTNTVEVSIGHESVTFNAVGVSPQLVKISGDEQQGWLGSTLANPLVVEVKDLDNNPLPGVEVTFTVTDGEGMLSGQSTVEQVTTDANGRAEAILTLGPDSVTNTVEVSIGHESVTFNAVGVSPQLVKISGDEQQGWLGSTLANPLVVEVKDLDNNPLPGVEVTFTVTDGEGMLSGQFTVEQVTTDANGRAERTFTLGANSVGNTVEVSIGHESVTFYAVVGVSPYEIATLEGHTAGVYSVVFSPAGTMLASASFDGTVKLWGGASGAEITTLEGHTRYVWSVVFSPDGTRLASASLDGTVKLWDVATRENIATLEGHTASVYSVVFSPDGTTLASASYDNTIKLWDVATRENIATLEGHTSSVRSVVFSPDGTMLVSASDDRTVKLWDVATRENIATLEGHTRNVNSVVFSPDGTTLASASADRTVKLWDVATRENIATLEGHTDRVNSVVFSPDGTLLASASLYGTGLWNVATGALITFFGGHTRDVNSVAFSPDGTLLASGSSDGTVKLWDVSEWTDVSPSQLVKISGDDQEGMSGAALANPLIVEVRDQDDNPLPDVQVTFIVTAGYGKLSGQSTVEHATTDANGRAEAILTLGPIPGTNTVEVSLSLRAFATFNAEAVGTPDTPSSMDGDYRTWHLPDGAIARLGKGRLDDVAFSPDGQRLAVASGIGVWLYDVVTSRELALLPSASFVYSVVFSPDGRLLASASADSTVKLWDVVTRENIATLEGHTDGVWSVVFSPDGRLLASASEDGTVKLWDGATRESIATLKGHTDGVWSVVFSPDGTRLASASDDRRVKLWDVATRAEIATLSGHRSYVTSVVFSPDGTRLASASDDGTVKLWDVATKKNIATLKGHTDGVWSVVFSPDGTTLASGSQDRTVKLWDGATREVIATLEGHTIAVHSVVFSPDGTMLASGSFDGTVKLWDGATREVIATLEGHTIAVHSVVFSPDGTMLASGSQDRTVKLWDAVTRAEIATLEGHTGNVFSVVFSPDGTRLASGSSDGTILLWDGAEWTNSGTAVAASKLIGLPDEPQLQQNAPNPFNSQTILSYFLPKSGPVRLELFSVTGQRVAVLRQGPQQAGYHRLRWNAQDGEGRPLASGIYFYRLETADGILTRKLTLLR